MQINLGYDDIGQYDNDTIILIGGLGTQRTVWPNNFCQELVQNNYRVIRFDNRDIGESTFFNNQSSIELSSEVEKALEGGNFSSPYTLLDMAQDTIKLIDNLNLNNFHVIGMSMGARIGQIIASLHPANIKSLTSIMSTSGASYLPKSSKEASEILAKKPRDNSNIDELIELAIMQQRIIGSPNYPMPDEYIRQIVKLNFIRGNNPDGVIRQWLASYNEGDQTNLLSKIEVPVLVIHGNDDPLIPIDAGRDLAKKIKNSKFVAIEGMGHNIPPSLSKFLSEKIISFLDKLDLTKKTSS